MIALSRLDQKVLPAPHEQFIQWSLDLRNLLLFKLVLNVPNTPQNNYKTGNVTK